MTNWKAETCRTKPCQRRKGHKVYVTFVFLVTGLYDLGDLHVYWQRQVERRAAPRPGALGPDFAALRINQVPCDRQPNPSAAAPARPRFVHAVETLEDMREMFGGDPDPAVLHTDLDERFVRFGRE